MKNIKKYNFSKVYDLQNSSRTAFYKKILFPKATKDTWSSTDTTLPEGTSKEDFDKDSVLSRFDHQLKSSGINTNHTLNPDFSWSTTDISQIKNYHQLDKYILLFPFCSPHLTSKKWPYYNELIAMINEKSDNKFKVVIAPGPSEIKEASNINALCVLDNGKALDISQLATLIKDSSFVVANDTGPAHMTAHLGSKGIVLFGAHTTAYKVSIERENFRAIQVNIIFFLVSNIGHFLVFSNQYTVTKLISVYDDGLVYAANLFVSTVVVLAVFHALLAVSRKRLAKTRSTRVS